MDDLTALALNGFQNERWLPVVGFEGLYEVSDRGRICSHVGKTPSFIGGRVVKSGYVLLSLRRDGKTHERHLHSVVLEAFVGPCPEGTEACHWDGARYHNALSNLRWDTRKANSADRVRHGTNSAPPLLRGTDHPATRLTVDDVRCIKAEPKFRGVLTMLARAFDVDVSVIWGIRHGRTWKHVNG